jgi:hypothetical protein
MTRRAALAGGVVKLGDRTKIAWGRSAGGAEDRKEPVAPPPRATVHGTEQN